MPDSSPLIIRVTGKPVAKARPRATTIGVHARMYTPKTTASWENDARQRARVAMMGLSIKSGPLQLVAVAHFVPSMSWPTRKKDMALAGGVMHTAKPDGDNILKACKDALNGVVYLDDAQVVESGAVKKYATEPSVKIIVTELDGHPCQIKRRPG